VSSYWLAVGVQLLRAGGCPATGVSSYCAATASYCELVGVQLL